MARVKILPANIDLEVESYESVAEAAWRQGFIWPTQCWGQLECMSCFTKIVDGERDALPAGDAELDAVRMKMPGPLASDSLVRLACQLRCRGESLVLEKRGVREALSEDNNMQDFRRSAT